MTDDADATDTDTDEDRFDIQVTRDSPSQPGKVLVRFRGRLVRTLVDAADVAAFRAAVASGDDAEVQLLAARKTGNFKRGNERVAKKGEP